MSIAVETTKEQGLKKTLRGTVVSSAMKDTVVVEVNRYVKHPKYKKYFTRTTRIKVHNPGNTAEVGKEVVIVGCRPLSKGKHFKIV
jgi:small subunit ribosomal protein S17